MPTNPPKQPASRAEGMHSAGADPAPAPNSALGLQGLAWLLAAQAAGELLTRAMALALPGPVLGIVLLLAVLRWPGARASVGVCAHFLLAHLSLLFVPVGVGVMTHLGLLSQYGGRMLAVLVLSTVVGLATTVLAMHWLRDKDHD